MHSSHDDNTYRVFPYYGFTETAVAMSQCVWVVLGGLSLHTVLAGYSSAIK